MSAELLALRDDSKIRWDRLFILLSVAIAATRLFALARTMFDWDEALFVLGVDDYDVWRHHPHPPGYPLFVAAAKLVHLVVGSELRSLQIVVVVASCFLFPALFWLAREIGFNSATSVSGAALFVFLPNVWVYGGTAFSDIPTLTIALAACALLLRGRRDPRAYLLGGLALGIAAGFRPAALLLGFVPAVLSTYVRARKSLRTAGLAILLGAAVAGGSYVGAALSSVSVRGYVEAVKEQSRWVHDVDSWHNPGRPPLGEAALRFLVSPVQLRQIPVLPVLALVSIAGVLFRRSYAPPLAIAIFGPLAIVSWINLDIAAAGRYALAYLPAYALLAADGIAVVLRLLRVSQAMAARLQAASSGSLIVLFAIGTWPALTMQRTTDAPPIAALQWIQQNVREGEPVYVHAAVKPQTWVIVPRHRVIFFDKDEDLAAAPSEAWIVDMKAVPGARNFVRSHDALWEILRQRNFESSVRALADRVTYEDGWYQEETDGERTWRWTNREARARFPPLRGLGRLAIRMYAPIDSIPPPTIEVYLNDRLVERFVAASAVIEKTWLVPARAEAPNEFRIVTSATVSPSRIRRASDTRELGLRIDGLEWTPPWGLNR